MRWANWLPRQFTPQTLGERGERSAARYLRRQGMRIVEMRSRSRYGEVDIVAVDGRTIVFVEVKTRRGQSHGRPADAVDQRRQQRLTRAALAYLKAHALLQYPARFDVVEVIWPAGCGRPTAVRHFRSAFEAIGNGQFFR